jgi:hypothetical protein
VELQGDDLTGGLVFREFIPLRSLGQHPESGKFRRDFSYGRQGAKRSSVVAGPISASEPC